MINLVEDAYMVTANPNARMSPTSFPQSVREFLLQLPGKHKE